MKNQTVIKNLEGEKYIEHALQNPEMKRFIMKNWYRILGLPVCSRCERPALWDREGNEGVARCKSCGTVTKNPITMLEFLEAAHHIDRTVRRDANPIVDGEKVDAVVEVTAEEAGLPGDPNRVIKVGIKER